MTRIRYKKTGHSLEAGPFVADKQSIVIKIEKRDSHDFALDIHSLDTGNLLISEGSMSLAILKRSAKAHCISLGVQFDGEIRNGVSRE